jgi:Tudor domain
MFVIRLYNILFSRVYKRDKQEPLVIDMVQCGMAVSGYPNMENIPPAQNYTAPPRVAVPPLQHHHQPSPAAYQPLSPNYPPPVSPNLAAAATVFPQQRTAAGGRPPVSPVPSSATGWSNGTNGANNAHTFSSERPVASPMLPRAIHQSTAAGAGSRSGVAAAAQPAPPSPSSSGGPHATLFRPLLLETKTWYNVYISANEAGPADFSIQLANLSQQLEAVMADINSCPLRPLAAPAVQVGLACLARYSVDNTIYRAVILQRADTVKVKSALMH